MPLTELEDGSAAPASGRALTHLFLSPHLDDAVFSCGGTLWAARVRDQPVRVVTFFAASPPQDELSPFARHLHRQWGDRPNPYRVRRGEDRRALVTLRLKGRHYGHLDAIYRQGPSGWLYPTEAAVFGTVHPEDVAMIDRLAKEMEAYCEELSPVRLYIPLGIGSHVDHQVVRRAAEQVPQVERRYYEDFPYVARVSWEAPPGMRPDVLDVTAYLAPKLDAMAQYGSQILELFGSLEAMRRETGDYMAKVGGERFWIPTSEAIV